MNILSFVPDYWDGPRHNRHYFCQELAKHHKVMFISPPFYIVKVLEDLRRGILPKSGIRQVNENLITYVPPKWLFTNHRWPWLDRLFRRLRIFRLRRLAKKFGFTDPILLVWHPRHLEVVGQLNEQLVVYYIYDHLSGYSGGTSGVRASTELELIRRSDLVFVLSAQLYEENKKYASNIHVLPNAVDFEHFSKARDVLTPIPDDIANIPRPRVGYIGTINEKVDVDLLLRIAGRKPEWSLVLIGRQNYSNPEQHRKFDLLVSHPNVYWLLYKDPAVVPAYLKALDVCLMCYVVNGWTFFGDPSKMHEYLAAGKPTIGAPLPAIREFEKVIPIPETQEEWIAAIERGIGENDPQAVEERIRVAFENSYPRRVERAVAMINETLKQRLARDV